MDVEAYLERFDRRDWQETTEGTVRFAMIGLGWWTREQAIPAIAKSGLCETTVVASSSKEKAESVAADHGSIEHALTYEEFHDGSATDAYDAVYVCTPNALHLPYVQTAAELDKDVLCEKPMEADVERAEELVEAASEAGTTLMIAYRMHTEPAIRRARELIDDGVIGDPALVHGTMTQRILELVPDPDQWRLDPDLVGYGSSVMDVGIYPLNTTRFLLRRDPVTASATAVTLNEAYEDVPDERVAFQVEYEGGVLASFSASQNANQESHVRITGTEGRIVVEPAFFPWTDRGFELSVNGERASIEWEQVDQMKEEFEYFAHCLLTGQEPYANGEHGLVDLRAIRSIYEAAESGQRVEIRDRTGS